MALLVAPAVTAIVAEADTEVDIPPSTIATPVKASFRTTRTSVPRTCPRFPHLRAWIGAVAVDEDVPMATVAAAEVAEAVLPLSTASNVIEKSLLSDGNV
jgi:hypothetical protein